MGWEPVEPAALPPRFVLASTGLCACHLVFALPIGVLAGTGELSATIGVELELGPPRESGGIESELVWLELRVGDRRVRSSGKSGWFENELVELERCPDLKQKTCFGCGLSDYSPYGLGLFGDLMCFRDNKLAYRAVRSKEDLFAIIDTVTEQVQETYVCCDFEPRVPGAGYRG